MAKKKFDPPLQRGERVYIMDRDQPKINGQWVNYAGEDSRGHIVSYNMEDYILQAKNIFREAHPPKKEETIYGGDRVRFIGGGWRQGLLGLVYHVTEDSITVDVLFDGATHVAKIVRTLLVKEEKPLEFKTGDDVQWTVGKDTFHSVVVGESSRGKDYIEVVPTGHSRDFVSCHVLKSKLSLSSGDISPKILYQHLVGRSFSAEEIREWAEAGENYLCGSIWNKRDNGYLADERTVLRVEKMYGKWAMQVTDTGVNVWFALEGFEDFVNSRSQNLFMKKPQEDLHAIQKDQERAEMLLEQARAWYPVGTVYKGVDTLSTYTVRNPEFFSIAWSGNNPQIYAEFGRGMLYSDGKWAKIITPASREAAGELLHQDVKKKKSKQLQEAALQEPVVFVRSQKKRKLII